MEQANTVVSIDRSHSKASFSSPEIPGEYHKTTQLGNAERFVAHHKGQVLYCHSWRKWLLWNGKQWKPDESGQIFHKATDTVRSIYREASSIQQDDIREAVGKHARRSESRFEIEAMLALAQAQLAVKPQQLDCDPMLFNCQSGVIDLRTGALNKHCSGDLLSKISPVHYDATSKCPIWLAFLYRTFREDEALVSFVQRVLGYSLTGAVSEKAMFVLHGDGDNGKTTLLEAFRYVLGDYAGVVDISSLMQSAQNSDTQRTVAELLGKRFVTSSETEEGQKLNESRIKNMTGMARLVGRTQSGKPVAYAPLFKLFIDANHKPVIRGSDTTIWNRIRLLPFEVSIPKHEQDRQLLQKLRSEAPGILAWAVRGCLEWRQVGYLVNPAAVDSAVNEYKDEMDIVAEFVAECCEVGEHLEESASKLYAAFRSWCDSRREAYISNTAFGRRLQQKKFEGSRSSTDRRRKGLALRPSCDQSTALQLAA